MSTSFKNTIPFSPRSISGLQLWLDAADSSSYTITSSRVMQWNDKSGNNYHMTPIGANQSNITLSSAFQNRLNVMNSSGRVMYRTPINSAVYPSDCFLVLASKALARTDFFSFGNTTGDNFNSLTLGEYTTLRWHNGSSTFSRTPNTVSPTNETSTGFLLMQWSLANNNYILRRNGTLLTQTSSYTYTLGGNPAYQIGYRHTDQTTSLLDCEAYFAEILVFNSQITTSQREQVEGYLAWKWGINANLPSTHPFRSGIVPFSFTLQRTPAKFTQTFDPRSVSGLQLWLDAPSITGLSDGATISRWVDRSSNALIGTAVNSPTYRTNVQNGLPVIRFNGTNQYINFGNVLNLGTNGITIFMVTKYTINAGNQVGMIGKSSYRGNPGRWGMSYDTVAAGPNGIGIYNFIDDTNNFLTAIAFNPATRFNIFTGVNNRTSSNVIYSNGSFGNQQTFTASANNLSNTDPLYIASYPNSTGSGPQAGMFMNGDIGEILVYFSALTTAQRQQVEGYLGRKWNISLVSTHPNANPLTLAPFSHAIISRAMKPNRFTPTQISGCQLWLDAADASTVLLSGSSVTQWRDKSGNGYNTSNLTGAPSYSANGIVFTGTTTTGQAMGTNLGYAASLSNSSIFVIASYAGTFVNNGAFIETDNRLGNNGCGLDFFVNSSAQQIVNGWNTGQIVAGASGLSLNTKYIHGFTFATGSSGTAIVYLNGTQSGIRSSYNFTYTAGGFVSLSAWKLGSTFSYFFNGVINEILIYNSIVSTQQRQQIEGYLAWKWGLKASLPATHPYANFPPPS